MLILLHPPPISSSPLLLHSAPGFILLLVFPIFKSQQTILRFQNRTLRMNFEYAMKPKTSTACTALHQKWIFPYLALPFPPDSCIVGHSSWLPFSENLFWRFWCFFCLSYQKLTKWGVWILFTAWVTGCHQTPNCNEVPQRWGTFPKKVSNRKCSNQLQWIYYKYKVF